MRIVHALAPVISEDTEAKEVLFGLDSELALVTLDGFTEESSGRAVLPVDVPYTLPMGPITVCKGCVVVVAGDANININGLGLIQLRRGVKGPLATDLAATSRFFFEGDITSLAVTPVSATLPTVVVRYALYGDPVV